MSTQRLASVLNLLSDRLSRVRPADDCKLTKKTTRFLIRHEVPVRMHHFAVCFTAISRYTSRFAYSHAEVAAFEAQWRSGDVLTAPPQALPLVISRLRRRNPSRLVLVTPDWPAQPWFYLAQQLSHHFRRLPFPAWQRGDQSFLWHGRFFFLTSPPFTNFLTPITFPQPPFVARR